MKETGITEYKNRDYIIVSGRKYNHLCKTCQFRDIDWRARQNTVRIYCSDFQPIPDFMFNSGSK